MRWRLGLWLSPEGWIPWGTLAANWLGAVLMAVGGLLAKGDRRYRESQLADSRAGARTADA